MSYPLQELQQVFFQDPRWTGVEELIRDYLEPLLDMRKIDTSKDAEDVKAQVIGRLEAYNQLDRFLSHIKLIGQPKKLEDKRNPYR